ncbi:hypothetical protein ABTH94_22205, partial [Acinetobacter baumannii]
RLSKTDFSEAVRAFGGSAEDAGEAAAGVGAGAAAGVVRTGGGVVATAGLGSTGRGSRGRDSLGLWVMTEVGTIGLRSAA